RGDGGGPRHRQRAAGFRRGDRETVGPRRGGRGARPGGGVEPRRRPARAQDGGTDRDALNDVGLRSRPRPRVADAEARAGRGLDAPGSEPPRESSDRGPVQGGAPPAVRRRSPARRGGFGVSSSAGGGSVSAHAREPQRGQDPDRLATRLMYL